MPIAKYAKQNITLKYFPANNWTPIIAKISQNMRHTSSTLKMDGIAWTKALTTTYAKDYFVNNCQFYDSILK